jgi:hypothetical protein
VKSLIENKTDDTGLPDRETVWGAIPDDEKVRVSHHVLLIGLPP